MEFPVNAVSLIHWGLGQLEKEIIKLKNFPNGKPCV